MRLLVVLIIYSFSIFAGEEETALWQQFINDPGHQEVVQLAFEARGTHAHDDFSERLSSLLPDFTHNNSIQEASLLAFQKINKDEVTPIIEELQGLEDNQGTKDIVLFLKDENNNPLAIMKWFQSSSLYLGEISAMEKLAALNLNQSHLAMPVLVGKASWNGRPYYLLVETVAKGETITSLIQAIDLYPEGTERNEAIEKASRAVIMQAAAIAEIHAFKGNDEISDIPMWKVDEVATYLNQINPAFSIDDLVGEIKDIEADYHALKHPKRYRLGDPNWGNFLYYDATSEISLIDVHFLNFSIGEQGEPTGDAAFDHSLLMSHFWFLHTELSREEKELILTTFDQTYQSIIQGEGVTDLELKFAYLDRWMNYIYSALISDGEISHFLDERVQDLRQRLSMAMSS